MLNNKPRVKTNFPPRSYSKLHPMVTVSREAIYPADIYWYRSEILKLWFLYNAQLAYEYFKRG